MASLTNSVNILKNMTGALCPLHAAYCMLHAASCAPPGGTDSKSQTPSPEFDPLIVAHKIVLTLTATLTLTLTLTLALTLPTDNSWVS